VCVVCRESSAPEWPFESPAEPSLTASAARMASLQEGDFSGTIIAEPCPSRYGAGVPETGGPKRQAISQRRNLCPKHFRPLFTTLSIPVGQNG